MIDVEKMMDFESGMMDEDELIEFFQGLVNSGMAWSLQGSYGRLAARMIEAGLIAPPNRNEGARNDETT